MKGAIEIAVHLSVTLRLLFGTIAGTSANLGRCATSETVFREAIRQHLEICEQLFKTGELQSQE